MEIDLNITKDLYEYCDKRYSVRKFDNKNIDETTIQLVQSYLDQLNKICSDIVKMRILTENCMDYCNVHGSTLEQNQQDENRIKEEIFGGCLMQLLQLYLWSLDLKSVFLGMDGVMYSGKKLQEKFQLKNKPMVVMAIGYKDEKDHQFTKRKDISKVVQDWPQDKLDLYNKIVRAPSSVNQQPYTMKYVDDNTIQITAHNQFVNKVSKMFAQYDYRLDTGIAAAHVCAYFQKSKVEINGDICTITKLQ